MKTNKTNLITRNDMINFCMSSGIFKLEVLQKMDPKQLEEIFKAGLEAKGLA